MALYTTDTHSLIWHFTKSPMLGKNAKKCLAEIESGLSSTYVPIIVMAETFHIARKRKVDCDYENLLHRIIVSPNYFLHPFDYDILVKLVDLNMLSELHDQIIVATAMVTSSILITKDKDIANSGLVKVIW